MTLWQNGPRQVWRGSLLLADLLLGRPQLVAARTVAELGAGCGLAGIAAARAGARRVLATDLPPLLPQLQVGSPDTQPRGS
jgi:predicted nicotinamide N-methyase